MTLAALLLAAALLLSASVTGFLEDLARGLGGGAVVAIKVATWAITAALASAAIAALYRYAPARSHAQWAWLTPGSVLATLGLVATTLGFGFYAASFGNYNATYGSLGAVVVLLMWLYLSAYVLLLGAEFNAELEHQTARDTTAGPEKSLGQRGAKMADEVADDGAVSHAGSNIAFPQRPSVAKHDRNNVGRLIGLAAALLAAKNLASGAVTTLRGRDGPTDPGQAP